MNHTFIVNTENVNEYGYRILTDGIDTKQYLRNPVVLYMHDRFDDDNKGSEVIGRTVKLWVENNQLLCEVEFDMEDEFAAKICGKVERGFIRMASMYADVLACSNAPEDIMPGQIFETVTKCKLIEISIVDIGGNDDALKLSRNGESMKLQKLSTNKTEDMSNLKVIALAYGLPADADEAAILAKHNELKIAKDAAEGSVVKLTADLTALRGTTATDLVDECIKLGLFPEALKDDQIKAFENDFDGKKVLLSKMISDHKEANPGDKNNALKEVVLGAAAKGTQGTEETFDFLQKFDVAKLQKMQAENPTQYAKLYADYQNGVRHIAKV